MTTTERDLMEFKRLQSIYPLFKFELDGSHLTVTFNEGSTFQPSINNGRLDHEATRYLDNAHMQKTISQDLMKIYPDLYISTYASKDGCFISVWVKRNNDDAESVGEHMLNLCSVELHNTLQKWQFEAKKAKQDNWFYCSGHCKAEPKSEYGYFYFAGRYCKQYGIENPNHKLEAGRETYN